MKEDILEQIVEDYFALQGYFTTHNVKFKPDSTHHAYESRADSVASDIDVLAYHPLKKDPERIVAISCKSWQGGFNPGRFLALLKKPDAKVAGKAAWKHFRELAVDKWGRALCDEIDRRAGSRHFTYVVAATRIDGETKEWETNADFISRLGGSPIQVLDLATMLKDIVKRMGTAPAPSQLGRLLQVMRAARIDGTELASLLKGPK